MSEEEQERETDEDLFAEGTLVADFDNEREDDGADEEGDGIK